MRLHHLAAAAAVLALATAAQSQPHGAPPSAAPQSGTVDLQGDSRAFMNNPHVHAFYDLSVATLRPGAPKLDVKAYEEKSFAIFRAMGAAMGGSPEAMQDHLKLIPRQVVQIAREDPNVLDSFEAFTEALVGPK
ncbi:MAG: hypothetical protein KKE02_02830 [Alphaproteobacteria bacterium]|nr:hypothetical protein [Alphaproteobacteria bacterium]MBU1513386.1 hypothetical protein [Alphaproteobacteria bacterium]MBU2096378.1 hypothetical protein [Alphaproteobacteria bacterium]MBU2149930.1 hypothetical protein [Alphaproteobacteria bacterium]MBU2309872.1 hypothetical protein [Alphaproteobacteria bacterium]